MKKSGSKDTSQRAGARGRSGTQKPGAGRQAPAPRARGARPHPTAHTPIPPRSRSTAAARATSRPIPQARPPSPPACVRLACAACIRGAACAAARRAASACCARACLCRFSCAQARGRRTRRRDLPPTSPQTPPRVRTHVHEGGRFERPSSPPRSRPVLPEQIRRTSLAASHQEGGRGGGAPSTATATTTTTRERSRRKFKARTIIYETRNYKRRTDRRMQSWLTHTKLHIRTFNDINFSTNRIKECFGSYKTRSSPVLWWIGFCERGALAAAAQARGHICPKDGP